MVRTQGCGSWNPGSNPGSRLYFEGKFIPKKSVIIMKQNYSTVKGMRDFMPEQARKKQFIEDFLRRLFERYGFEPLQTPVVEEFGLLAAKGSGGEAVKDEIYYFKDKSDRELGLRYDLTVPLARVVASDPSFHRPFRRYCIGTVYRYDKPQAMRYREFTQADADIVGAKGALSDFECLQMYCDAMRGLGFAFKVKVNNRALLEDLAKKCGVAPEQVKDCFRSIDKLDKIGEKEVEKELEEKGIPAGILEQIRANSFEAIKALVPESEGVKNLGEVFALCAENGLGEVTFDVSLARGLEYYTGIVFEVSIAKGPSVGGGGRYDRLIGNYGGQPTPAVGISFGVDRLYDALAGTLTMGPNSDLLIIPVSEQAFPATTRLAAKIRALGGAVEMDVMGRGVKKALDYANKKGIAFIAVIGENEVKSGRLKAKDMASGSEKEFGLGDAAEIRTLLKGG